MTTDIPERAAELHRSLIVIDGHCDTALDLAGVSFSEEGARARDFLARSGRGHVDLPRLKDGGLTCQTMTLFTEDRYLADAKIHTLKLLQAVERVFERTEEFFLARSADDILRAKREGRVAALLAIEGGECIGENLDDLRALYARGVRMFGLTWSRRNALGRGVDGAGTGGLTEFGRRAVAEMERLGIIVDASHLSDEALDDVLKIAQRPVVASHSNARVVCPHRRNLTDDQAARIAASGGLVGLCFAGVFIDADPARVSLDRLMDHLDRMVAAAGVEHVGLGSDFDGWTTAYGVAVSDCAALPTLTAAMLERGYAPEDIARIMGGNWLKVIREIVG